MKVSEQYKEYKKLKDLLNQKKFKSIKWGYVLSTDIWAFLSLKKSKRVLFSIKKLIRSLFFKNFQMKTMQNDPNPETMLFYVDRGRADYDRMQSKVRSCTNKHIEKTLILRKKFTLLKFLKIFKIFKISRILKSIDNTMLRFCLSSQILFYLELYDLLIQDKKRYRHVVTFCDAHAFENLCAQIYKKKNVKTSTLQHGMYSFNRNSVSCIQHECFVSDQILLWGELTQREFLKAGIEKERIPIAGHPNYIDYNFPTIKDNKINDSMNYFGIILGGPNLYETNIEMIKISNKIAEEFNLKYIIRKHPSDSKELYKQFYSGNFHEYSTGETIIEYSKEVDFSLIHSSSVFYELIAILSPAFIYQDGKNKFYHDSMKNITFTNHSDLISIITTLKNEYNEILTYSNVIRKQYFYIGNVRKKYEELLKP